jgi:DNA polymerase III gamma/tau subunit
MLDIVERLVSEGYQLPHFCAQLARIARNLLVTRVSGPNPDLLEAPPEEIERWATLAQQFSEERLMRLLGILLELHREIRVSMEPRFQMELGLLKLVDAERLVAIEELLGRMGSLGQAVPLSAETSGISGREAVAPKSAPTSLRSSSSPSLRPSSASRPSPFEQDLARKRQAQAQPTPIPTNENDPGRGVEVSPEDPPHTVSGRVSSRAVSRAVSEDLPSREVAWVHEVLRRLEEGSKPVLASLLADHERWEFGESEVRIRLADSGIARVLPDADRRFLDRLVSDVLDRTVRVQFAEDWKGPSSLPSAPAEGRTANRTSESPLEGRVRGDPEVAEFESLFGKRVTDIRPRKD